MSVLGYYITCDDALCPECFGEAYGFFGHLDSEQERWDGQVQNWKAAGGFESWDEPIAIFRDEESDTPTHCKECGELIPHALTSEGYEYVREHIIDALFELDGARVLGEDDVTHPDAFAVVRSWWEQYGDDMDEAEIADMAAKCFDLTELIDKALGVE